MMSLRNVPLARYGVANSGHLTEFCRCLAKSHVLLRWDEVYEPQSLDCMAVRCVQLPFRHDLRKKKDSFHVYIMCLLSTGLLGCFPRTKYASFRNLDLKSCDSNSNVNCGETLFTLVLRGQVLIPAFCFFKSRSLCTG